MDNEQKNLEDLFGTKEMSEAQRDDFMKRVGNIVMESSVIRLLATLTEEQIEKLESHLVDESEPEALLKYLLSTYPEFETIIGEEINAFRAEAIEIMG